MANILLGGPMTVEERNQFEVDPLFEQSLKLRKYDEQAKIKDKKLVDLDHYKNMVKGL